MSVSLKILLYVVLLSQTNLGLSMPFVLPHPDWEKNEEFRLHQVESNPELNIRYDVYQTNDNVNYSNIAIIFGNLNEKQFRFLKKTYGQGLSNIFYDRNKFYDLTDFLPPAMQALYGHHFLDEVSPGKRRIPCNCWGTAYELVRGAEEFAVFYADQDAVQRFFFDQRYSEQITEIPSTGPTYDATTQLRSGDLFIYTDGYYLAHAAVFVDRNLFFDKPGKNTINPFRLIIGKGLNEHPARRGDKVDIRRFRSAGKLPVPHPRELLTYNGKPIVYKNFRFEYETIGYHAGRAFFPKYYYEIALEAGRVKIPLPFQNKEISVADSCRDVWLERRTVANTH